MPIFVIARHFVQTVTRRRAVALIAFAAGIVLIGATLFSLTQHLSFGTSLYWAVTTATTVGYGDITPHNTAGRIIASAVMLTTIPTIGAVFALWTGAAVLTHVRRLLGMDSTLPTTDYTLVYGSSAVLPRALSELAAGGDAVVLVAPERPPGLPDTVTLIAGDPTDDAVVKLSAPAQANRALIATDSDADTLVIAVSVHALAPDLEVYALTQSPRVARALTELGVTHTLAADELVGHTLAKSLETPQAGSLLLQLVDTSNFRLFERDVEPQMVSQPLSRARARSDQLVLGISRGNTVELGLGDDPVLTAADRLIVLEQAS